MRDHEDCGAELAVERFKAIEQHAGGFGIEGPGWLIRKDQGGVGNHRPCARNALLLASGELVGIFPQDTINFKPFCDVVHTAVNLLSGSADHGQRQAMFQKQ